MAVQDVIEETERLRKASQKLRADAVQTRIAAAHCVCGLTEIQARWTSAEVAQDGLEKVWHAIDELRRHLSERDHIAATDLPDLRQKLDMLETRAARIGVALRLQRSRTRAAGAR